MSETAPSSTETANVCYRHPDRESFVRCQRCGRTICPQCQTQAAVGVHCPECVREARGSAPRSQSPFTRVGRALKPTSGRPIVTIVLIALCLVIYGLQFATGDKVTSALLYAPVYTPTQPWRMITTIFVHGSIIHVLVNMYSLWVLGPPLEAMLGRVRFLALFLIAGFGGSVGVLLLAGPGTAVVGASGAIFGLFAAFFMIQRRLGAGAGQFLITIGINLVITFALPGIAWQAHVGGAIVGAAIGFVYLETRNRRQRPLQVAGVAGIAVLLVIATAIKAALL